MSVIPYNIKMDEGEPPRTRSRFVQVRENRRVIITGGGYIFTAPSRNLVPLLGTGEGPFLDEDVHQSGTIDFPGELAAGMHLGYSVSGRLPTIKDVLQCQEFGTHASLREKIIPEADPDYIMLLTTVKRSFDRNFHHHEIGVLFGFYEKFKQMTRGRMKRANREIVLPLSWNDLGNTPLEENALNWKTFLRFARKSLLDIPPNYHGALLLSCGSLLSYQAKSLTTPFHDFQFGKSTNTPPQLLLLTFGEAFDAFFPEMAHIMMFMICYILTWMLVLPLQPGAQIFCMLLLISMPLFYFPELVRKASGVSVACGSFKLPLVGFATLGAIGLSLVCGLVTLLMVYFSWRFIYKGKPRVINEVEVSLDDLSHVLEG